MSSLDDRSVVLTSSKCEGIPGCASVANASSPAGHVRAADDEGGYDEIRVGTGTVCALVYCASQIFFFGRLASFTK